MHTGSTTFGTTSRISRRGYRDTTTPRHGAVEMPCLHPAATHDDTGR